MKSVSLNLNGNKRLSESNVRSPADFQSRICHWQSSTKAKFAWRMQTNANFVRFVARTRLRLICKRSERTRRTQIDHRPTESVIYSTFSRSKSKFKSKIIQNRPLKFRQKKPAQLAPLSSSCFEKITDCFLSGVCIFLSSSGFTRLFSSFHN